LRNSKGSLTKYVLDADDSATFSRIFVGSSYACPQVESARLSASNADYWAAIEF
jgi:hypothetical protein